MIIFRTPGRPTPEQAVAGNYAKPTLDWHDLTIAIENPEGTVREGVDETGKPWRTVFRFAYGEFLGTCGVDGDPVDVYVGQYTEATEVYVVRQMKRKKWDQFDEDKCFVNFRSMDDARDAYLEHYDDPRFYGGVIALPVSEFITKVRATKTKPDMIKSILFFKAHVGAYLRAGKLVQGYQGRNARAVAGPGQMSLFGGVESSKTSIEQFKDLARSNPKFVRDTLDQRLRAAGEDYEIREVPHAEIKPLQTGADYLNDSSRETARRIKAGDVRRNEDLLPIRLSHDGKILDGHHRHASAGLNGEKTMLAMVPVGSGRGRIRNISDFAKDPQHTEPTKDLIAEHEHLVDVLRSPSHEDDKVEADKQAEELNEMKQEAGERKPVLSPRDLSSEDRAHWSELHEQHKRLVYHDVPKHAAKREKLVTQMQDHEATSHSAMLDEMQSASFGDSQRALQMNESKNAFKQKAREVSAKIDLHDRKTSELQSRISDLAERKGKMVSGTHDLRFDTASQSLRSNEAEAAFAKDEMKRQRSMKPEPMAKSIIFLTCPR